MRKTSKSLILIATGLLLVSPVIFLMLAIITGMGAHYRAPSDSMAPSINVGDHFYVSRVNYRFSKAKNPNRGDVIVFKNSKTNLVMVKRVIALSGETVQIKEGRVILNGKVVRRKLVDSFKYQSYHDRVVGVDQYQEFLPKNDKRYDIYEETDTGRLDNTELFHVPAGHVFVMGNNRDNSIDSRVSRAQRGVGFVSIENIIGEATYIMFQSKKCIVESDMHCPPKRFMKKL